MLSNNYLISFLGGTDLKKADDFDKDPSALIQIINFIMPKTIYLFITTEMIEVYEKSNLKKNIISLFPKINIIDMPKKKLKDPTDTKQIYESIYGDLKEISEKLTEEKIQGFVNLTSGTPQIISVLSLCLLTGILERSYGVYAANPKFNQPAKTDKLEFFKNSIGFESLKRLIDKYNYNGVSSLFKEFYFVPKIDIDPELALIVDFAKYRFNAYFDDAYKIYLKSRFLQNLFPEYSQGDSLDHCLERYYTLNALHQNENNSLAIIWIATIKETLAEYVVEQLYKENFSLITIKEDPKNPRFFNISKLNKIYPDFKEFAEKCWIKDGLSNKPFSFESSLKQPAYKYLLSYAITKEFEGFDKKVLKNLETNLVALENCYNIRNKVAHTISSRDLDPVWIKKAFAAIKYSFKLFRNKDISSDNPYDLINKELKARIEKIFC